VHGEFVVLDGSGGYSTVLTQTGTITAISPTSITVRSEDGYSQTYVIPNTAGNAGPPFAVDDHVVLRAARNGQTATVTNIGNPQQHGPSGPGATATPELVAYPPPFEKPSGTEAVTVGLAIDVASSAGAVVDVVVSPSVISGPSPTVPGASLNTTVSVPIATSAPAPIPAATSLS
jgi:hypothetical protein